MADITFYWPYMHEIRADGTIVMRATGYDGDWRWTGERSFSPDSSDYGFWHWIVSQRGRWTPASIFSSDDLPSFQQEYAENVRWSEEQRAAAQGDPP